MKKWLFILFGSMLLCSCSCLLSQIPPQYIYAGEGCTAPLPDYKTQVVVTGGCYGFTVTQTPLPGFLLTAVNKEVTVEIKATGANLKSSKVSFLVSMLDTITPKITPLPSLLAYQTQQVKEIYDAGDRISIAMFKEFDANFPDSISSGPNYNDEMLVSISIDSAGTRKRLVTTADSIVINPGPFVKWEDLLNRPSEFVAMVHGHSWNQIEHPDLIEYEHLLGQLAQNLYLPFRKQTTAEVTSFPVNETEGTPLLYDNTVKKFKYWNGTVWKTLTTN